ncbi:hypothetical protein UA08_06702 [Talaromyces atroroseus]|uniref:Carbonic anhydrase n=1 Tax=Talaromyces atroroseus TaxID=1441469 RepID=A0A225AUL8_TALAT|nr:hypothetical protein UA08_06702 [Talaromyces atroroseus]OKL58115.1 hypothetical protein UA08_06702 [Talaromyces atroroseus]
MPPTVAELVGRNNKTLTTHIPALSFKENAEAGIGPPRVVIISCVDPRVTPEKYFRLNPMEALVFRNIAGHPQSCWKDIATLDTFLIEFFKNSGLEQLIVVHHTDCGSTVFTNDMIRQGLRKRLPESREIAEMDFGAVSTSIEQSVRDDLAWLETTPFIRKELADSATGFVYDIKSGKLHQV